MEKLKERLRGKELRKRRIEAAKLQDKKRRNGNHLDTPDMRLLYALTRINPIEVGEEIEVLVDARIEKGDFTEDDYNY